MKILVVDDERVLVKGIKFNLESEGYQVEAGYDGEQAVELARSAARPGDIVSLSPASASFDRYPNFEARGREYKQIVNALPEAEPRA